MPAVTFDPALQSDLLTLNREFPDGAELPGTTACSGCRLRAAPTDEARRCSVTPMEIGTILKENKHRSSNKYLPAVRPGSGGY